MRFFIKQVNLFKVGPIYDEDGTTPLTTSVVTANLYDPDGASLSGVVSLTHSSGGVYLGKFPAFDVAAGDPDYEIEIEAIDGGETVFWSRRKITSEVNGAS